MNKFRDLLLKEKEELTAELAAYKREDPYTGSTRDEITSSEDTLTKTESHDRIVATRLELKQNLSQVERALGKVEKGTYGICENCGKPIPKARLTAMPTAKFGLDCEKQLKKKA